MNDMFLFLRHKNEVFIRQIGYKNKINIIKLELKLRRETKVNL